MSHRAFGHALRRRPAASSSGGEAPGGASWRRRLQVIYRNKGGCGGGGGQDGCLAKERHFCKWFVGANLHGKQWAPRRDPASAQPDGADFGAVIARALRLERTGGALHFASLFP